MAKLSAILLIVVLACSVQSASILQALQPPQDSIKNTKAAIQNGPVSSHAQAKVQTKVLSPSRGTLAGHAEEDNPIFGDDFFGGLLDDMEAENNAPKTFEGHCEWHYGPWGLISRQNFDILWNDMLKLEIVPHSFYLYGELVSMEGENIRCKDIEARYCEVAAALRETDPSLFNQNTDYCQ